MLYIRFLLTASCPVHRISVLSHWHFFKSHLLPRLFFFNCSVWSDILLSVLLFQFSLISQRGPTLLLGTFNSSFFFFFNHPPDLCFDEIQSLNCRQYSHRVLLQLSQMFLSLQTHSCMHLHPKYVSLPPSFTLSLTHTLLYFIKDAIVCWCCRF